ncbi:MAG: hypothetical protein GYA51_07720, partial [Candidatus Methanofastidiosa archaeon]|nr:hypothetical protein [Candidatus Methanofastidiosa archaeon]
NLLEKIVPEGTNTPQTVAVISVGANNRWGFPAQEVLQMLEDKNISVLRTDKIGDVQMISDGERLWQKN